MINRILLYSSIVLACLAVVMIMAGDSKEHIEDFCHDATVTVTVYRAVKSQTNRNPNITASGFIIRNEVNLVAVSRDLLKYYPYGTLIEIDHFEINQNYGRLFIVLDVTNKRLVNTVDILIDKDDQIGKWTDVRIRKVNMDITTSK